MDGPKFGIRETSEAAEDSIVQRGSGTQATARPLDGDPVEALHRAQSSLRTLMEISAELVVVHREGKIVYANPAVGHALGLRTDDILGTALAQLFHADDRAGVETRVMCPPANSAEEIFGIRWCKHNGGYRTTEAVVAPIDFEGSGAQVLVARDVSKVLHPSAIPAKPNEPREAHRLRLLVIDDDRLVAEAIARSLSRDGDVEVVNDARQALERIAAGQSYDVILCDLMMPVMTGMDFYAEVMRVEPKLARRIMFMTGGAFTARARAFVESVVNTCLEKPLDMIELRSLLARTGRE
jgi:PAS domain S-box-containing protein